MKTQIIKKSAVALIVITMLSSCTDLFNVADIKTNPNNPNQTQVGVDQLMTGALVGLGVLYEDTDNRIASMWSGQLGGASRQHLALAQYNVSSATFGWYNYYNTAVNLRYVQEAAAKVSKAQVGAAQVAEALVFAKMAGLWGDIPYSEALNIAKFATPKYDGQAAVYASLITLLDQAYTNIKAGGGITGDPIYGGDETKWAGAAKTLQARLNLHLKNYAAAAASAQLGIANNASDFLIPHGTSQQVDMNLNYDFFKNSRPGDTAFDPAFGAYLPGFMSTPITTGTVGTLGVTGRNAKTNDANLYAAFFGFESVASGDGTIDPNVKNGVFQANSFSPVLTYYENQLILAEAIERQASAAVVDPLAIAALNSVRTGLATGTIFGAKYSLKTSTYTAYDVTDFAPGGSVNPATGPYAGMTPQTAALREIASQKYIILLMQYESFTEIRRLAAATPVINLGVPLIAGTKLPERFIYPQNEINTNPNTPSPAPDQFTKLPIF